MSRALTVRHGKSFKADGLQPQPELQDRSRFFNNPIKFFTLQS